MTTRTKLIAFYGHYCQVYETILFVNADIIYLPYVQQSTVRRDVEIYNSENGIEELKKIIKWARKWLKDENINDKYFLFCRFHGHFISNEKINCRKNGCSDCLFCPAYFH